MVLFKVYASQISNPMVYWSIAPVDLSLLVGYIITFVFLDSLISRAYYPAKVELRSKIY